MNDRLADALDGVVIAFRSGMRRVIVLLLAVVVLMAIFAVTSVLSATYAARQVGQARDIEARMLSVERGQERATEAAEGAQSAAVAVSARIDDVPRLEVAPGPSSGAVLLVRPPPGVSAPPIAVPLRP